MALKGSFLQAMTSFLQCVQPGQGTMIGWGEIGKYSQFRSSYTTIQVYRKVNDIDYMYPIGCYRAYTALYA